MRVYIDNEDEYTSIKKLFENKNDNKCYALSQFFLLITYGTGNKKKDGYEKIKGFDVRKIKADINASIVNIDNVYKKYIDNIKNTIYTEYNDNKNDEKITNDFEIFNFFSNQTNSINYFSKFELREAESFDELKKHIFESINIEYKTFFSDEQTENFKEIKADIIEYTLFNILNNKMFNTKSSEERRIKQTELFGEINKKIEKFKNADDLYIEFTNSLFKFENNEQTKYFINNIEHVIIKLPMNYKRKFISKIIHLININDNMKSQSCFYIRYQLVQAINKIVDIKKLSKNEFIEYGRHVSQLLNFGTCVKVSSEKKYLDIFFGENNDLN